MLKAILNYQKASEKLINSLQTNRKVLAVFAFGSIVNGDLWEESDIDIFVVYKDQFYNMRDVYSEILDIPVHMKILNKEKFLELYENNGKKGEIRNMLTSSKLVFSRDEEIDILFNKAKYSMDKFVEIWNLVYLGKLIKDLGVTKKYLYNDRLFTSFEVLIRALDSFAKLYLNISGYTVSRDAIKMTMNLNNKFNMLVENLIEKELIPFEEVERLKEEKYSKKALNSNYPVLKEISNDAGEEEIDKAKRDERGYGRYYKTPIKAYGRTYLLVSQWVENQHRKYFSKWIETLKK